MDAPIAPAAVRSAEDGPAYDLISLGLVVLTLMVVGIWTTHYFQEPPAGNDDFDRVEARIQPETSAGHLALARWADFNLRSGTNDVSEEFRDHLKQALLLEPKEREQLRWKKENLVGPVHQQDRIAAIAELGENPDSPDGPAARWAKDWYRYRSEWIDAGDRLGFNRSAHLKFGALLEQMGLMAEAEAEWTKVRHAQPDWPIPSRKDDGLPVIREEHPR